MSVEASSKRDSGAGARAGVQKQIQLPFRVVWAISIKSIRIRLMRSLITASGIFLGIAFFSSVRTVGLFPVGLDAEAIAAANRQKWLAIMALLVCAVGITNAMLMSITERFKEIGTMKCLGALDKFIVMLFFIEASLMGVIASFLGWVGGWLVTVLAHLFSGGGKDLSGSFLFRSMGEIVLSVVLGTAITLIAAIPTARNAAKMQAVVALRSEI